MVPANSPPCPVLVIIFLCSPEITYFLTSLRSLGHSLNWKKSLIYSIFPKDLIFSKILFIPLSSGKN